MILAVPKLEHPCGRHVGCCRCGVDADSASLPVVDAQHGLMKRAVTRAHAFSDAEILQDRRQPILGEIVRAYL